ncbi:hypothetical protein WG66_004079, partial [Moniliophthora roreri]
MVNPLAAKSVRNLSVGFGKWKPEETQCLTAFCRLISQALPRAINLIFLGLYNGNFGSHVHLIEHYFYTGVFPKLRHVHLFMPFTKHMEEFIRCHRMSLELVVIFPYMTSNHDLRQKSRFLELPDLCKLQVCSSVATALLKNWSMPRLRFVSVFWSSVDSSSCEDLISALEYRAERSPNMFEFWVVDRPGLNLDLVRSVLKLPFLTHIMVHSTRVSSAALGITGSDGDIQAVQSFLSVSPRIESFQWAIFDEVGSPLDLDKYYMMVQSYGMSSSTLSKCCILSENVRWKRISVRGWFPNDDFDPRCFHWIFHKMSTGTYTPWDELLAYLRGDVFGRNPSMARYVIRFEEAIKRQSDEKYDATMDILAIL